MHRPQLAAVVFAVAAPFAAAQGLLSGGPLAGASVAIGVRGGSSVGPDATTLVHRNGFGGAPVGFPASSAAPNLQAILAAHGAPNVDVDDLSTGRDDVLVDTTGTIHVPTSAWGVLSLSFKNGAVGLPGSRLAAEAAAGAVGGHVFTWVLPGSALPANAVGVVERSHSRGELGLPVGADVDDLDFTVPMGRDQNALNSIEPGFSALLPSLPSIYFTVANTSLAAVPTSWWNWNGVATTPSGATIFRVQMAAVAAVWGTPQVFQPYFQLGLSVNEDIDGLAYDEPNQKLLFSCTGNARDQLLFLDLSTDVGGPPIVVKKADGTPVSQAVGTAQNDDIDAICTLDPQLRVQGGTWAPDDFGACVGTLHAAYQPGLYPVGMSASAYRRYSGGARFYDTWMLGYPPATGQGPGFAILAITLGDTLAPAVTASFQARNPASTVPGDPRSYSLAVPASYALVGFGVTFRWFAADSGLVQLAQALPVKAFL